MLLWLLLVAAGPASPAGAVMLYDGTRSELPTAQGWAYLTDPLLGEEATQNLGLECTVLDTTTDTSESAGYFTDIPILGKIHPGVPTLDRMAGYTLLFDVRVASENHGNPNRAGFSVIALSSDNLGIELAFWANEVWAQSAPDFTHSEGAGFDTTAQVTRYALAVEGDGYTLSADGAGLLSGSLRDYPESAHQIYGYTSFLFFGDDTSSAAVQIELARIEVLTGTAIPEPGSLLLVALAAMVLVAFRRGSARAKQFP